MKTVPIVKDKESIHLRRVILYNEFHDSCYKTLFNSGNFFP